MMAGADAQQWRVAEPIRDTGAHQLGPISLVPDRIARIEADMAEMRNADIAPRKIARARVIRPCDDLDLVAARVARLDDAAGASLLAVLFIREGRAVAGILESGADRVEIDRVFEIEADRMVARIALEIDESVVARIAAHRYDVAAEIRGFAFAAGELQAENLGRVIDRAFEVARAEADVADILQIDHGEILHRP